MKKIILIGAVILSLSACSKKKPFESIKKGMSKEKVSALIGEPEQKMPMFIMEWWMYPKDNKLVVMRNDTVVRVVMDLKASQDSMKTMSKDMEKAGEDMKKALDSL